MTETIHTLSIMPRFLDAIQKGKKTIEGRINQGKAASFKVGDCICFSDAILCRITKIEAYPTFSKMLEASGYKNCIPDANSLDEALALYNSIPGYSNRVQEHGCLAIHIQPSEKQLCKQ